MLDMKTVRTMPVRELAVGDVVIGIGSVAFDEPHTVTEVTRGSVIASGGCFWPIPIMGNGVAVVL